MGLQKSILAIALGAAVSLPALATNGHIPHGTGAPSKGMAGAGVAMVLDYLNGYNNPATLAHLDSGLDVSISLFSPDRSYTADNNAMSPPFAGFPPGTTKSDNDLFLIPAFAYNRKLNDSTSIGISFVANGGMNTEYNKAVLAPFNNPGGMATSPTGLVWEQIAVFIPFSHKLNERHSFGFAPVLVYQRLEAKGLGPFKSFSYAPGSLTDQGSDYSHGVGASFGWLSQLSDRLSLGVSYRTKISMSRFEKYKGLLINGGELDIPETFTIGIAYKATPKVTVAFDAQHIRYSDASAFSNEHNVLFTPGSTLLGTPDAIGFGWDDTTVLKLGVQWQYSPTLTLRAGFSHILDQIIPESAGLFNILAPARLFAIISVLDLAKR